jgi:GT2 family glycosyltransferase
MNNVNPLISVVVPNWNGNRFIRQCLDSLFSQTFQDFEIVVFDNASTDGSLDVVKNQYPDVRLIESPVNLGFARANNGGVKASQGKFVFLINNDTIIDPDCLEKIYSFYQKKECAVVTGKMVFPDRKTLDHAGGMYSRIGIALDRGLLSRDIAQFNYPFKVDYAHGSCLFIQKELYERVDGFDQDFFQYVEDVDFGLKIKSLGYDIYYCPDATLVHYDGGTTGRENRRRTYYMVTNLAATMFKIYTVPALFLFFPLFLFSRFGLGVAYLLKGRFDLFAGVMTGIINIPKGLPKAIKKRKKLRMAGDYRMFKGEFGIFRILKEAVYFFWKS